MTDPAWIPCQEPGCPNGIGVDWRHVRNFESRFYCPQHDGPSGIDDLEEVPC